MNHSKNKIIATVVISLLLASETCTAAKLALLIGNQNYTNSTALQNTLNDVDLIGEQLDKLGFLVIKANNKNLNELKGELRSFHKKIRVGDVGLIYYSGHGLQYQSDNYLVPIGADITISSEIPREAISSSEVIAYMDKADVKIIILDACRNNPYKTGGKSIGKGLKRQDLTEQNNTLIAFAASPNQEASDGTGINSPYALALKDALQLEGKTLEQVFKKVRKQVSSLTSGKQTPWYNASLVDDIYLNGRPSSATLKNDLDHISKKPIPVSDEEIVFWKEVSAKNTKNYYLGYLDKYGHNGRFSDGAKLKIKKLESGMPTIKSKGGDYTSDQLEAINYFNSI